MNWKTLLKEHYKSIIKIYVLFFIGFLAGWLSTPEAFFSRDFFYFFILFMIFSTLIFIQAYIKEKSWRKQLLTHQKTHSLTSLNYITPQTPQQKFYYDYLIEQNELNRQEFYQLKQQIEEHKLFIDQWVHEIKIPLASLSLIYEIIEQDLDDFLSQEFQISIYRLEHYVDQVLYAARLDSFSQDYIIRQIPLKDIRQDLMNYWNPFLTQKKITWSCQNTDLIILTDEKWLLFILNQIISNAIKYTPELGEIHITLTQQQKEYQLKICDSGIGILKEDIPRVFERGFTGNNGRIPGQHATGMGLYLAKTLTDKLNMALSIDSKINQGTCVTLHIPTHIILKNN